MTPTPVARSTKWLNPPGCGRNAPCAAPSGAAKRCPAAGSPACPAHSDGPWW